MQATDCDDGEDPAESPETAAPAESTEGDGDSPAEPHESPENGETGEAEGDESAPSPESETPAEKPRKKRGRKKKNSDA
jgi:hypothetical protein